MKIIRYGLLVVISAGLFGCGGGKSDPAPSAAPVVPEPSYCSTVQTYSPSVTVTATAQFYYRPLGTVSSTHSLVGNPVATSISAAEVTVLDSAGNVVQCGQTAANGSISVSIPKTAGTYTLKVSSRASNTVLKASVLNDITNNAPYFISTTFSVASTDSSVSAGTLTAYARVSEAPNLEGAAFNILKQLYLANEYIRTSLSQSSWVADKVTVYWKVGFNPYTYYGSSSALSFYATGERKLYILGGSNGNVSTVDTDHFDNSVILHEYGHFLEDVYGKSDSPGGSHNGNLIIDPQLAWSEGWANYFQAAVLGTNYYADTIGYCSDTVETGGSCSQNVYILLDESGTAASFDRVSTAGEGTFREISISRSLYKTTKTPLQANPPQVAIPFSEVWSVFAGSSTGFHSAGVHFRNAGKFFTLLNSIVTTSYSSSATAWSNLQTNEKQAVKTYYYADPVTAVTAASCSAYPRSLSPVADSTLCVSASTCYKLSNKFLSNHFYQYYHSGAAGTTIKITYTPGTPNINLDLVIYKETHSYFEEQMEAQGNSSVAVRSVLSYALDGGTEQVSMDGLPAGYYLINVKAATYGKTTSQLSGTASYTLKETISSTEKHLCPDNPTP